MPCIRIFSFVGRELAAEALRLIARDYGTENDSYKVVERNLNLSREKNGGK